VRPILFIALLLPLSPFASAKPLFGLGKPKATPVPALSRKEQIEAREEPEPFKAFNMEQLSRTGTATKTFYTRGARTDEFYYEQKMRTKAFDSEEYKPKGFWGRLFSFGTKDAPTKTYGTKSVETKTAATKDLWDGNKVAATRDLPDGRREYLGPESKKLHKALDPNNLPKITGDGPVTEIKTEDDVRALLNKN
jgi:hypothetical protein